MCRRTVSVSHSDSSDLTLFFATSETRQDVVFGQTGRGREKGRGGEGG